MTQKLAKHSIVKPQVNSGSPKDAGAKTGQLAALQCRMSVWDSFITGPLQGDETIKDKSPNGLKNTVSGQNPPRTKFVC